VRRALRVTAALLLVWAALVALPSIPAVRGLLAAPLVLHDDDARGDVAYVLAGGQGRYERLRAAADLFHEGRVPRLLLLRDDRRGPYRFAAGASWTASRWALGYAEWLGIPRDRVELVAGDPHATLGTLAEARAVAAALPADCHRLVIVTSAAHTRRARLAFRRALPERVELQVFAATPFAESAEASLPLWLEYAKLLVYAIVA